MKKALALVLTAAMMICMFAGCGSKSSAPAAPAATQTPADNGNVAAPVAPAAPAAKKPQIGAVFYSVTDDLGSSVFTLCNEFASVMGLPDIIWQAGKVDNDGQIDQVQNLVSAGVDGIMIIPMSDTVTLKTSQLCEEAGIYFSLCFRTITDPDIRAEVEANPYYVGMVHENEQAAAQHLIALQAAAGHTNLGMMYATVGNPVGDARNEGFEAGITSEGMNKLADCVCMGSSDLNYYTTNIQNFLSSFPEMNAIVMGGASGGSGETVINAIQSYGKDSGITFTTFDTYGGMKEGFEAGILIGAAGGMFPDALYSMALLYNSCVGNPLSDEPVELLQPYLFVENMEDFDMFQTYIVDKTQLAKVFTEDFVATLAKENNPSLSVEGMQALMDEYCFDWIKAQVG